MDDLLAGMSTACQGGKTCETPHDQVGWCPAWDCWLCSACRWRRNDRELRMPRPAAERKLMRDAGVT